MSNSSRKITIIAIAVLSMIAIYFLFTIFLSPKVEEVSFQKMIEIVEENPSTYKKVVVDANSNAVLYNKEGKNGTAVYSTSIYKNEAAFYASVYEFVQIYSTSPKSNTWMNTLMWVLLIGGTVVLIVLVFRQMSGGDSKAMNFGKTQAKVTDNLKVRFDDVAGAEEEKQELSEIVEFLKAPKKFADMGAKIPRGILLVGPPGTGKTLFAKAVAGEANVPFFSISGSDFVEMFVGVGASRVRDLFAVAKKNTPCIVFIDEIDAVGRQRGAGMGGGHDEREQTLNQLLVQMDGFETNQGIIVMAATNRADILDPALLRPGRFDRQIFVNVPDVRGREEIFKVHSRNKPLASDVNFKILAHITIGFTGADIANVLNEAAILAARMNRKQILMKDVQEAINKVLLGPQKRSRLVTESDKRVTAYHESGHAILAKILPHCNPVHEVSIIQRGGAAGYTMTRPDNDDNHQKKSQWLDHITMALGGRVAEEIVIGDICTGASADIKNVTSIARAMVTEWGMSDLGTLFFGSEREIFIGREFGSHNTCSEETSAKIDEEMFKIVNSCLAKARKLLKENEDKLHVMARVLIEHETIFTEEVDLIMEGKTAQEVGDSLEARFSKDKEDYYGVKALSKEATEKNAENLEKPKTSSQNTGENADKKPQ